MPSDRAQKPGRAPFVEGCIDSIPVCISFAFLFFAVGNLCATHHYSLAQAASMTALVFAAPLQVFIVQNGETLSLAALVVACVLINFIFLIMSSMLSEKFKKIALAKVLLSIPMLSASTFTLSNLKGESGSPFHYYLGVGAAAIGTALAATVGGTIAAAKSDAYINDVVAIILPVHFTALTALMWPKLRPVLITVLSFLVAPIAGHWLGKLTVVVMPFVMASLFLLWEKKDGK